MEKPVKFTIDNVSGISNNTKLTYKGKKITVEKLLNDLSDKYDFGWVVISNAANNKVDGTIVIRKSSKAKERGYEAGKEPKKTSADEIELPRKNTKDPKVLASAISPFAPFAFFGGQRTNSATVATAAPR